MFIVSFSQGSGSFFSQDSRFLLTTPHRRTRAEGAPDLGVGLGGAGLHPGMWYSKEDSLFKGKEH